MAFEPLLLYLKTLFPRLAECSSMPPLIEDRLAAECGSRDIGSDLAFALHACAYLSLLAFGFLCRCILPLCLQLCMCMLICGVTCAVLPAIVYLCVCLNCCYNYLCTYTALYLCLLCYCLSVSAFCLVFLPLVVRACGGALLCVSLPCLSLSGAPFFFKIKWIGTKKFFQMF